MANQQDKPGEIRVSSKTTYEFDLSKAGNNLWDTIFHVMDGDLGTALQKVIESGAQPKSMESLAYEWIFTALRKTCRGLLEENFPDQYQKLNSLIQSPAPYPIDLKSEFNKLDVRVNGDFFNKPDGIKFLRPFRDIFARFLKSLDINDEEILNVTLIFPIKFIEALQATYQENIEKFKKVKDATEVILKEAYIYNKIKFEHYKNLEAAYHNFVMGDEDLRLSDIYVEPNFKVYRNCYPDKNDESFDREGFAKVDFADSIHIYINKHFLKGQAGLNLTESESSRMLILLGQPGQGKSSFCLKTCYELINDTSFEKNLTLIRLKELVDVNSFLANPQAELQTLLQASGYNLENTVLLLDGLDELYMGQSMNKEGMRMLLYKLGKLVQYYSNLFLIITSRYNYIDLNQFHRSNALILNLDTLTLDQQKEWLKKYTHKKAECNLTPKILEEVNDRINEKKYGHIKELISQPILLHLVETSGLDIRDAKNRAEIYNRLFDAIINRSWDKGQLKKYQKLQVSEYGKEDFRDYLGDIALKIYQSQFEYIHRQDLLEMDETIVFQKRYLEDYEDPEMIIRDILVSFYFRSVDLHVKDIKSRRQQTNAIEFYHKSLQEYLVAERIWKKIAEAYTDKDRRGFRLNRWEEALEIIYKLISPKPLSPEVTDYLIELIEIDQTYNKEELRDQMTSFFQDMLERDFIYEFLGKSGQVEPFRKAASCFHAYWTILSYVRNGKKVINEDNRASLRRFLLNTNLLWLDNHFNFSREVLTYEKEDLDANFPGEAFEFGLVGIWLPRSDLSNTVLNRVNLMNAWIWEANLSGCQLKGAVLRHATLIKSDLGGANLEMANLEGANLEGANLEGANLQGANLEGANLQGANLRRAYLQGSNLHETKLENASLEEVHLDGAWNFSSAQLLSAKSLYKIKGLHKNFKIEISQVEPILFFAPE